MPATASVSATGNQSIDGILSGVKWATTNLTFSFPTSGSFYNYWSEPSTFASLSTHTQNAVRSILNMYSSFANVTFTEVTETSTTHADLRFADTQYHPISHAFLPSAEESGGDVWFQRDGTYGNHFNFVPVGYFGHFGVMHEIGRALGLKHGHEAGGLGQLNSIVDNMTNTVMSHRSYPNAPTTSYSTNEGSFAQTPMVLDIAALQHMYGANYNHNSGDTVYRWSPTTGEMFLNGVGQGRPSYNKIFMTVWDGGGNDTYDFSSYTETVRVELAPGKLTWTSEQQRAELSDDILAEGSIFNALLFQGDTRSLIENAIGGSGNDTLKGNDVANNLRGGGGNDTLWGLGGDDTLIGEAGNDGLVGFEGFDTAVFSGNLIQYTIRLVSSGLSYMVTDGRAGAPDGADGCTHVERFQFADRAIDVSALNIGPDGYVTSAVTADWGVFWDPTDTQDWLSYIETYNGSGAALTQFGTFDDGTGWGKFWDPTNAVNFTFYQEHYVAGGARDAQGGTYNDGTGWAIYWDVNSTNNWVSYQEQFVAGGAKSAEGGTYDDGRLWAKYWDPTGENNWSFYQEQFNTGGQKTGEGGTYDDGRGWAKYWDPTNANNWSFYQEQLNTDGQVTAEGGTYDDGRGWAKFWDPSNTNLWSFIEQQLNAAGEVTAEGGTYDDGRRWEKFWDRADAVAWERYEQYFNSSGDMTARTWYWDDGTTTVETLGGAGMIASAGATSAATQSETSPMSLSLDLFVNENDYAFF